MAVRPRGKNFQADIKDNQTGKRHRATFKTRAEAKAWEATARLALEQGRQVPFPSNSTNKATPASGLVTAAVDLSRLGELCHFVVRTEWHIKRSGKDLIRNANAVVGYFAPDKLVRNITAADIANMKLHFEAKGNSPATVNRKLAALSKLLNVAVDHGVIDRAPRIPRNKERKNRFRHLTREEEARLLNYWIDQNEPLMFDLTAFLLDTGARVYSEALRIKWGDLQPFNTHVTFWETKTGKPRTVPLTSRCRHLLSDAFKECGQRDEALERVFKGLTGSKVQRLWDKMRQELEGFEDVTPHTLRHTCCTRLVEGGADIKRVMEWMGHNNAATAMRYMQMRPKALEDVVHMLEPPKENETVEEAILPHAA